VGAEGSELNKLTKMGKLAQAIDVVDIGVTGFAVGLGIAMLLFFRINMIFNARVAGGIQNPYPLLYSVAFSTHDGKEIYRYIEMALIENRNPAGGFDIEEYLNSLDLNETCWMLFNSSGGVIFGNCTGYGKRALIPFVNGTLGVFYG